ncbi:MAG: APC family permease [Acidobacteriia bacterium]|nr:APC family permease [Terriglobia bacterium]
MNTSQTSTPPVGLARAMKTKEYFTLAFGTMVGVGWLMVMDDWLRRGGPLGAMLGFAIGGAALLPIGYVYGKLVMLIPDAGSEIAYTERVFPSGISFFTGWIMMLAYLIVCPWEAVAIGKILAYIFPGLNSYPLYSIAGKAVFLPQLAIGLGLVAFITWMNYRGIRLSSTFQTWMTFTMLALFALFGSFGVGHGSIHNWLPLFSHSRFVSVILIIQVVPYFMTGFESVPKCAEEADASFRSRGFFNAILLALAVGVLFYVSVIGIVAYIYPWQPLTTQSFATAFAFEHAFRARWIVNLILAAALISLIKILNGNFIAASRLLFSLGRRALVNPALGKIHQVNHTPSVSVWWIGIVSAAATLLGEAILIPITEVGSLASAIGWMAACAAFYQLSSKRRLRAIAIAGIGVTVLLVLIKIIPQIPGHFDLAEYIALGVWLMLGFVLHQSGRRGNSG